MKSFIDEQILLRDWTHYHRALAYATIAFLALFVYHSIAVIDGGWFEVKSRAVIKASPREIWAYVIDADKRSRWEARLLDVIPMKGATDSPFSTRLLTEGAPGRRTQSSFETTSSFVTFEEIRFAIEADAEERRFTIQLREIAPCQTEVLLAEAIREKSYDARVISPLFRFDRSSRLDDSLEGLARWMKRESSCQNG